MLWRVLGARRLRLRAQRLGCFPLPCSVLFWQPGQRENGQPLIFIRDRSRVPPFWRDTQMREMLTPRLLLSHVARRGWTATRSLEPRGGAELGGGSSRGGSWQRVLRNPRRWSGWPECPLPSGEVPSRRGHAPGPPVYAAPSPGTAAAAGRCARCLCKSPVPPRGDAPPPGSGQRPRKAAALQSGDPGHPRSPLRAGRRPRRRRWPGRP